MVSTRLYGRVDFVEQQGTKPAHYKCSVSAGMRFGFVLESIAYDSAYYAAAKLALGMREEGINATIVINDMTAKPPTVLVFEGDKPVKDEDGGEWWNENA